MNSFLTKLNTFAQNSEIMFIKQIYIKNLWQKGNILWDLREDVNVLVGINGSGKSTILNLAYEALQPEVSDEAKKRHFSLITEMVIHFSDNSFVTVDSSGERFPTNVEKLGFNIFKIGTFDIFGSLDELISGLYPKFENYQKRAQKRFSDALRTPSALPTNEIIADIFGRNKIFMDTLNELFKPTGKSFSEDNFNFKLDNQQYELSHQQLSSGEKQVFYILLQALIQDGKPSILLLDEPEISLHIEWQRDLIHHIRQLNGNCQVIAVTHSSSMFYGGWLEHKKNIEEIRRPQSFGLQIGLTSEDVPALFAKEFRRIVEKQLRGRLFLAEINAMIHKNFYELTLDHCKQILKAIADEDLVPDHFTYTTLIAKTENQADALWLLEEMKKKKIAPNGVTYVNILRKTDAFEDAMRVFDKMRDDKIEPAIQHFSVLLGKAENPEIVEKVEELRALYAIPVNDIYSNKLRIKK
jgi:energy-coupling factor transporter ATP-binding protein EcfA2